jgi:hypothetical protein
LAVAGLVAWAGAAFYSVRLNPETQFLVRMSEIQERRAAATAAEARPRVILLGGSSMMFSVRGDQLRTNEGLPAVNLGLNAAVGAQVMTERALGFLRAGDTLILGFEPGLLAGAIEPSAAGVEFSYAMGHPEWAVRPKLAGQAVSIFSSLLALRPGGEHSFMLASKLATGKALYRYRAADATADGWNQTPAIRPLMQGEVGTLGLSQKAGAYLDSLAAWCRGHQVRLGYSLPWRYWSPANEERARRENAKFIRQLAGHVAVLKDETMGVTTDDFLFADTVWHLNARGADLRTQALGRQIRGWQVWRADELKNLAAVEWSGMGMGMETGMAPDDPARSKRAVMAVSYAN